MLCHAALLLLCSTTVLGYRPVGGNNVGGGNYNGNVSPATLQNGPLQEIFSWSQVDFDFPSPQARQQAIAYGSFVPESVAPVQAAAAGNRIFVTLPRWYNGVPATLTTVPFPTDSTSPLLRPYPNWEMNRQGNCDGITSVFRVKVDECNRLWVLDTGRVNSFVDPSQICPRQIVVFDLKTDRLIYRYRFPSDALKEDSLLVTLEVEYPRGQCGPVTSAVAYVADVTTYALIVADMSTGRAWRVTDKSMYPTPEAGSFPVNGESFELMDGVLGLALSPRKSQADRTLFYHAMSGFKQRWVKTSVLRNETGANTNPRAFESSPYTRHSQAAGCSIDENGVLFFGLVLSNQLACWNTRKPFNAQNMVSLMQDQRTLQFITSATVDPDSRLFLVSNRLQKFVLGTINPQEVNFRILMAPSTTALVRGTACERGGGVSGQVHQHGTSSGAPPNQLVFKP